MPYGESEDIEREASKLVANLYDETAENAERSALTIAGLARKGPEARRILLGFDVVPALGTLCTRDNEARTQAHGALGISAIASNFATYAPPNAANVLGRD